jgi:glycosyltransferase involved in cell wall biosynthesis
MSRSERRHGPPQRVLYSFPHPLGGAGIGETAARQVEGLRAAGVHVDVLAASIAAGWTAHPDDRTTLAWRGHRLRPRLVGADRAYTLHDRLVARTLAHRVSREPGRYDVVHVWPGATLHTARAAGAARITCVREAPNTHTGNAFAVSAALAEGLGLDLPTGHSHRPDTHRLAREEAEYEAVDAVLVPSDAALRTFPAHGVAADTCVRHRYGYATATAPATRPDRPREPLTFAFVGRGEPRKGLHVALQAWLQADLGPAARLVVAGSLLPGYADRLGPLLAQPTVEVLGFTDPARVYARAHALVLPSFEEGSALVTYEAQAWGCALLVSDAAGADMVPGRHGWLHTPGDVDALAGQFRRALRDPDELDRMGAAAFADRDRLTWTAATDELIAAYASAAAATKEGTWISGS